MELKKGNMPEMVDMSKIYITNRTSWQPLKALDVTGKRGFISPHSSCRHFTSRLKKYIGFYMVTCILPLK